MNVSLSRLTLVVVLVLVGTLGWAPGAEAGEPADALDVDSSCSPTSLDLTPPEVQDLIAGRELVPVGPASVQYVAGGAKLSQQPFQFFGPDGNLQQGTLSCSGTCEGNGCGVSGCDPEDGNCSVCNCTGESCGAACRCSKHVIVQME